MDQPASLPSKQAPLRRPRDGFLLVEAALTAAVLAIGLIAITQGIGSSLRSLATIQRYEIFLRLAESKLAEFEVQAPQYAQATPPQKLPRSGLFDGSYNAYQWKLSEAPISSPNIPTAVSDAVRLVTLAVSPKDSGQPQVRLQTIWPIEWLQ